MISNREQVTQMIVAAKVRKGLKWTHVAETIGMSKEWTTAGCLGQMAFNKDQAESLGQLFELSDEAVAWLKRLGVTYVRTGLSWADSFRPNAEAWFDRQMAALADFHVTLTFCFTPEHRGIEPHHTSPPLVPEEYAEFCARMVRRYAPGTARKAAAGEDGRHVAW